MNIIYCRSHDEVNIDLARSSCDEHGLILQIADERDELFPADASAIAIDLNHLVVRPDERREIARRLQNILLPYPVAVASYDLDPEVIHALQARGVLVFPNIGRQLFKELADAIGANRGDFAA
jgi:hypothetical protein